MPRSVRSTFSNRSSQSSKNHRRRNRSSSSGSTRSRGRDDISLILGRLDALQRDLSPLVCSVQALQQEAQEFQNRLSVLEEKVSRNDAPATPVQPLGGANMDDGETWAQRARRAGSAQERRVFLPEPARERSAPPKALGLGTRLVISGFEEPLDTTDFKVALKEIFPELPDVRITTRKLFDTRVRLDFDSYEAAKTFKQVQAARRPRYKDAPIYINWIVTRETATDAYLSRVAKRFLADNLEGTPSIRTCAFTHTVFVDKREVCYAQKGVVHRRPAWPAGVSWDAFQAHLAENTSRG